jgi:hypothetical protein
MSCPFKGTPEAAQQGKSACPFMTGGQTMSRKEFDENCREAVLAHVESDKRAIDEANKNEPIGQSAHAVRPPANI